MSRITNIYSNKPHKYLINKHNNNNRIIQILIVTKNSLIIHSMIKQKKFKVTIQIMIFLKIKRVGNHNNDFIIFYIFIFYLQEYI